MTLLGVFFASSALLGIGCSLNLGHINNDLLLDGQGKESVKSRIGIRFKFSWVGGLRDLLNGRGLFSLRESNLDCRCSRRLRNQLLFDSMVIVLNNLDLSLELVNLSLQKLLCNLSQELEIELNESTFHDFLTELNGLFFALLDDLPELI